MFLRLGHGAWRMSAYPHYKVLGTMAQWLLGAQCTVVSWLHGLLSDALRSNNGGGALAVMHSCGSNQRLCKQPSRQEMPQEEESQLRAACVARLPKGCCECRQDHAGEGGCAPHNSGLHPRGGLRVRAEVPGRGAPCCLLRAISLSHTEVQSIGAGCMRAWDILGRLWHCALTARYFMAACAKG